MFKSGTMIVGQRTLLHIMKAVYEWFVDRHRNGIRRVVEASSVRPSERKRVV